MVCSQNKVKKDERDRKLAREYYVRLLCDENVTSEYIYMYFEVV